MAALAIAAAASVLPACGNAGGEGAAVAGRARTVEIDMVDIAFRPDRVEVAAGERVRFVFANRGSLLHDAVVGDEATQRAHADEARRGGHGHGDADKALTVDPGETADLVHRFEEPGTAFIGCHQPGHYDAGMRVDVSVVERSGS